MRPVRNAFLAILAAATLAGCNTYYDPTDPYTRGLRFYDRGMTAIARGIWLPLQQKGDCDAQARYALVLFQDSDIPADPPQGLAMLREAANRGQPLAQIALGSLYFSGDIPGAGAGNTTIQCKNCGLAQSHAEAAKWLMLARKHAVYDGQRKYVDASLPQVKAKLSPQEISAVEQSAAEWKPSGPVCTPRSLW